VFYRFRESGGTCKAEVVVATKIDKLVVGDNQLAQCVLLLALAERSL